MMEARVFSWLAGVAVCWTLILMFGTMDFVSGRETDYERQDVFNTDSSNLTKLNRRRLGIHPQRFIQSRDTSDTQWAKAKRVPQPTEFQKREETLEKKRNDNQDSSQLSSDFVTIKRFRRVIYEMEELQSEYKKFHKLFRAFVRQIALTVNCSAPKDITNAYKILRYLRKKDPAFDKYDVESVLEKLNRVIDLAKLYLENVRSFVKFDHQSWLSNQIDAIRYQMGILHGAMIILYVEDMLPMRNAMDRLRRAYNPLHDLLSAFIPKLKKKFISGAPADLAKVDVLLTILPKDDLGFHNYYAHSVHLRANGVILGTHILLKHIAPWVKPHQRRWLRNKRMSIELQLLSVHIAFSEVEYYTGRPNTNSGYSVAAALGYDSQRKKYISDVQSLFAFYKALGVLPS